MNLTKDELLNIILGLRDREDFLKSKIKKVQNESLKKREDLIYFKYNLKTTIALSEKFEAEFREANR
jgi:hypothetical protein